MPTFVWRAAMFACDLQNGIIVKRVIRFEDTGPEGPHPYNYSHGDLTFEFRAVTDHDWRMYTSFTAKALHRPSTGIYIIENTIQTGLIQAKHQPLSSGDYQALKKNIGDGMLVLCTGGGEHFRRVPDFRLEFVEFMRDVPKQTPRPSDLQNVIAEGSSESPLLLGVHKDRDIRFVYKDSCVQDPEKGIAITRIRKFEELSFDDPMPYIYSQAGLEFEFRASILREWQIRTDDDGEKILRPHTATYVIEESIEHGLRTRDRSLTPDQFRQLMENIRAGMWAIETNCGDALRYVPDFRLEFVRSAKDAPRWAPRPSHWNFPKADP